MILPIYAYGNPVLKRKADDITSDHPGLAETVANMWETMYAAQGVGLAAPQVGLPLRIFVVDTIQILEEEKKPKASGGFLSMLWLRMSPVICGPTKRGA